MIYLKNTENEKNSKFSINFQYSIIIVIHINLMLKTAVMDVLQLSNYIIKLS